MRNDARRTQAAQTATLGLTIALLGAGLAGGCGASSLAEPTTRARSTEAREDGGLEPAAPTAPGRCARRATDALPVALRAGSQGSGSVALARTTGDRLLAYVAREDDDAISVVDVATRREIAAMPVAGGPSQLVVLSDGRVAASLRRANEIAIFEPARDASASWTERCRTGVAHAEPIGLATSHDGAALYVASGWGGALSTFGTADLDARGSIALAREPRAIVQPQDGGPLFVSHAVGSVVSRIEVGAGGRPASVRVVDLLAKRVNPRTDVTDRFGVNQGFALVATDSRLLVPGATVSSEGTFTDGYGGAERPVRPTVRVLDVASGEPVFRGMGLNRFDELVDECVLPRAADLGAEGKLYVACANVDAVLELDARVAEPAAYEMRRFLVPTGPTGLAVDPRTNVAVTWSPTRSEVGVVDLAIGASSAIALSARAEPRWSPREARGRALFRDGTEPRISFDGRACESCHPDGRDDGLTWSTPDGPRQTISLAGRVDASRGTFGWFGDHRSLEEHLRHTMKRLGGVGFARPVDRDDLGSLMAWLHAMPAPTTPAVAKVDDATIARGARAFEDVGCAKCHEGGGADGRAHDVKTGNVIEKSLAFDTPSLRGVAASAPYLHDGAFGTLDSLLAKADGPMGAAKSLDEADRAAIAAYMRSLGADSDARAPAGPLVAPASREAVPVARAAATGPFQTLLRSHGRASSGSKLLPFDLDALAVDEVDSLPQAVSVQYPIDPAIVASQTKSVADPDRDGVRYVAGTLRFDRPAWGTVHDGPYAYDQRSMDPVVPVERKNRFLDVSWARFDAAPGKPVAQSSAQPSAQPSGQPSAQPSEPAPQRFRRAEAYVDHARGEIALRNRVDVLVQPIMGTSVFAYIQRCRRCAVEDQTRLVLVGRSSYPEDLNLATVPIRRGGSGSATITVTTLSETPSWRHSDTNIRVMQNVTMEVSWAENEEKPSAFAAALR